MPAPSLIVPRVMKAPAQIMRFLIHPARLAIRVVRTKIALTRMTPYAM